MREELTVASADDMVALGRRLAAVLLPGDLVVLSGDLGAGKTTLVQGIGAGLGVRGPITSPTFVIARVHPSLTGGPALVHADAYRLTSPAEVDDLDLDASLETSVTVVEWGGGLVEDLAADRLDVSIALAVPASPSTPGPEGPGGGPGDGPGNDPGPGSDPGRATTPAGQRRAGTGSGATDGAAGRPRRPVGRTNGRRAAVAGWRDAIRLAR